MASFRQTFVILNHPVILEAEKFYSKIFLIRTSNGVHIFKLIISYSTKSQKKNQACLTGGIRTSPSARTQST